MESKISCKEIALSLSAYFDNELSEAETKQVEEHLENCQECASSLEKIKKLSELIKNHGNKTRSYFENLPPIEINLDSLAVCNNINEKLSSFIDRELSKDELANISDHLLECRFCRKDYEILKETQTAVKSYLTNSPKEDISLNMPWENIDKHLQMNRRKHIFMALAATAFILVLFTAISINVFEDIVSKESNVDHSEIIDSDKPIYVNSGDFLFSNTFTKQKSTYIPDKK